MVEYHAWEAHRGLGGAGVGVEHILVDSKVMVLASCECTVARFNTDTVLAISGECGSLMVCSFRSESQVTNDSISVLSCFRSEALLVVLLVATVRR